jgi:sulfate adenylyltransferase
VTTTPGSPAESADRPTAPLPQHHPSPRELDDLELLLTGALAPTRAFNEPGSSVTLELPEEFERQAREAGGFEIVDPEGLPLARVGFDSAAGWPVTSLTHAQYGPFRRLYRAPLATGEERVIVPVTGPVTEAQLAAVRTHGPVVFLAFVGHGTPELSPVGLIRATLAVAGDQDEVVAVPLPTHGDADLDHELGVRVAGNYAGEHGRVVGLIDDPEGELPDEVAAIVDFDRPPPQRQGLVLFFTGLSGSGKSTVAQAVMDALLEQGQRTVTSLDGDVVRRNLSAGLTFSKADRETNIRRIGWVAAEIARHGGLAVCSPIAPFDATRKHVRGLVQEAGGAFVLVHIATPLEECERRDRKGLYAKARRGEIPEFTGISSPYEEPADAALRIDTTGRSIEECRDQVLHHLAESHLIH